MICADTVCALIGKIFNGFKLVFKANYIADRIVIVDRILDE